MIDREISNKKIVFFDGVCNLCNRSIDYIIRHDKSEELYFSSLQSDFAISFLAHHAIDSSKLSNIVFYDKDNVSIEADAIFKISTGLSGAAVAFIRLFRFLPLALTNPIYRLTAKNRYAIWGKRETCRIPSKAEEQRFIS